MSDKLTTNEEEMSDADYEAFLTEIAKDCKARHRPCDGCQQGSFCEGEPEEHENDECPEDEDSEC